MSYSLFKTEIMALTGMQHVSRMQFAQVVGNAYNNLVLRCFETLSGGGQFLAAAGGVGALINGIHSITEQNLQQHNNIDFFNQIAPFIYTYWAGQPCIGPLGVVTVTSPGTFQGPIVPQNFDATIFINIFQGVVATHLLTLQGTYVNSITGVTTPWSGVTLMTTP